MTVSRQTANVCLDVFDLTSDTDRRDCSNMIKKLESRLLSQHEIHHMEMSLRLLGRCANRPCPHALALVASVSLDTFLRHFIRILLLLLAPARLFSSLYSSIF